MFELIQDKEDTNLFHVIANSLNDLDIQFLFTGSLLDAKELIDKLEFCVAKGFFKE